MDLLPILFLLGAAQGVFLAVALLNSKGGNRRANRYLAFYMLVFSAALTDYVLDTLGLTPQYVWLRTLLWPKEFLYGVLIYLYCLEITEPGRPLSTTMLWVLWLPPFIHCCVTWPLLWIAPQMQYAVLLNETGLPPFFNIWRLVLGDVELLVTIAHLSLFLLLSLRLVRRHRRRVLDSFSYLEKVSLDWLRNLLLITCVVYGIWIAEEFFSADLLSGRESLDTALALSMVVLIYALGWMGLRQPMVLFRDAGETGKPDLSGAQGSHADAVADAAPATAPEAAKYARSALSPDLARALVEELRTVMAREQPYLRPDLSLAELAGELSVSTNYLSQAINQQTGQNFFDLVNGYRVKHALPALADQKATILDVAMDAGFNSKSAFYAAFRKHQNMTPGAYRKQMASAAAA